MLRNNLAGAFRKRGSQCSAGSPVASRATLRSAVRGLTGSYTEVFMRVRFAPSPTGYLHIGSARTFIFNWLYARHNSGTVILRIDDTDLERNTEASLNSIFEGLNWLDLGWDELYRQSERLDLHRQSGRTNFSRRVSPTATSRRRIG